MEIDDVPELAMELNDADSFVDCNEFNESNADETPSCNDDLPYVDESDFDCLDELNVPDLSVKDKLLLWYLQYNISKNALTALLHILSPNFDLPACASTLLKNIIPKKTHSSEDSFHNFGLEEKVAERIASGLDHHVPKGSIYKKLEKEAQEEGKRLVTLTCNIDGVRLFNSTTMSMWPILCRVNEANNQSPFVASVFVGKCKPGCLNAFLMPFVMDYMSVQATNFIYGEASVGIKILFIVWDAPARAFCKGTKLYSGYDACDYCDQPGIHNKIYKKMVYAASSGNLRTDESFANFRETGHQIMHTPLTMVLPMVTSFPPDTMHAVYLGVMRRLLLCWSDEAHGRNRITPILKKQLSGQIQDLGKQMPFEFSRRPRGLNELKSWKAVEFRMFLMFMGPIVLKDVLGTEKYEHFLLLHYSMYTLASDSWEKYLPETKLSLQQFVAEVGQLYGEKELVYNVHLLLHITDYVQRFGPVEFWSAFWAESFLGVLRNRFKGRSHILSQAINRISEVHCIQETAGKDAERLGKKMQDSVFVTEIGIMKVQKLMPHGNCVGTIMDRMADLYTYPKQSGEHNIGIYCTNTGPLLSSKIIKKCVVFQQEEPGLFVVIPFPSSFYFGK